MPALAVNFAAFSLHGATCAMNACGYRMLLSMRWRTASALARLAYWRSQAGTNARRGDVSPAGYELFTSPAVRRSCLRNKQLFLLQFQR